MPPMKGEIMRKKSGLPAIEPPQVRKKMGRQKICRKKQPDEPKKSGLISR